MDIQNIPKRDGSRHTVPVDDGHVVRRQRAEQETSSRELGSVLVAAIDSLPEDLRIVFVLREVDGLSMIETSEILQISTEAVQVRLHRARVSLRKRVEKAVGEEVHSLFEFAGARCDRTVAQVFHRLGLSLVAP